MTDSVEQGDRWHAATVREWTDDDKVRAWRVWARQNHAAQRDVTQALLDAARLAPGLTVLDVAGGGGDPSLTAARVVGPAGHVTVTDVSPGMLATAEQLAGENGLTNLSFQLADAEQTLPFPDQSFDRVTCRCAVMFFSDHRHALTEMLRVLRPGGTAAFLAWGPVEEIPLFTALLNPLQAVLNPPPPEPGAPGPSTFAEPGTLAGALTDAAYHDVREERLISGYQWPGPPDELLNAVLDLGGARGALANLTADQRQQVLDQALAGYGAYADGQTVNLPLAYVLAAGRR